MCIESKSSLNFGNPESYFSFEQVSFHPKSKLKQTRERALKFKLLSSGQSNFYIICFKMGRKTLKYVILLPLAAVAMPVQQHDFDCEVKFGYSEKATKFEKIFHLKFDVTEQRQILSRRFFSNFVAFSEYPNFNEIDVLSY